MARYPVRREVAPREAVAATAEQLAVIAAPIYAALMAPWASLVGTPGGEAKHGELAASALAQAHGLWEAAGAMPVDAPVVVDVPYVAQEGDRLTCTMGNWLNEPSGYVYRWHIDDVPVGGGSSAYEVQTADIGRTGSCVVSATNMLGTTSAPASNGVVVADPGGE